MKYLYFTMLSAYVKLAYWFLPDICLRIYNLGSVAVLLAVFGVLPANFKWQKKIKLFLELRDF